MRNFISVFLLFAFAACHNERVNITSVAFDHIGNSDKPFTSLFMTTEKAQLRNEEWVRSILVTEETLQFIDRFIEKNSSLFFQKNALGHMENIAFRISINNYKFVLIGRKETVILFRKLSDALLNNNKLNKGDVSLINVYLENIILRLNW